MRIFLQKALLTNVVLVLLAGGQGIPPSSSPVPDSGARDNGKIIQFLSATISWYRERASEQKLATEPADVAFLQENARVADQVVQQAFESARAEAQLLSRQRSGQQQASQSQPGGTNQYQGLNQALQKVEQQIQDTQAELQTNREKLTRVPPVKRPLLQATVDELESELGLLNARRDAVQAMAEFVSASASGNQVGLRAQIEELARSVPAASSRTPGAGQGQATSEPSPSVATTVTSKPQPTGIWGLSTDLLRLSGKVQSINDEFSATDNIRKTADALRGPLIEQLKADLQQADRLFAAADTATPAGLAQETQQLDLLTTQFKQLSSAVLPLSKVSVLLGIYESTLGNWRESVRSEEHDELRQLLLRLAVLAILIAIVFGLGEIWRRAGYRYVHDTRRRYQFLLLRRIVIWAAVGLIIIFTFASQLGSAVTFAGLITAGIAVAMQNVITSIVGYFFLIGKYGLRVGDRVQIAGVTGEVVEIGLVRIHLMELGGPAESQPTGRIVAFSNSIVFQSGPGIFKQIPGTNFVWHELKLTLAAETDFHAAKDRITKAVDAALANYRENIDMQRQMVERNLTTVSAAGLQPKVRLHYTASGIEVIVRYPVELEKAAEVDDHLMRELITDFAQEPKLKLISAEIPTVKA